MPSLASTFVEDAQQPASLAASFKEDPEVVEPGLGESLARGAFQGVTLGFGDELSGAVRSLIDGTSYAQERDAARGANAAASDAHPYAYGGAELAGGLAVPVPGLGPGASIASHALSAAAAGGLASLGSSNADLTKGNFGDAVKDTVEGALLGGAIGAVGGKIGQKFAKAGEKSEDLAIRALAGGESKNSSAAWQKTRRMINNEETRNILHEPVQLETEAGKTKSTSLENSAGKSPEVIKDLVEHQTNKIGEELRPIYEKADAKSGGVSITKYVQHLDDEIAKTKSMAPTEARVYADAYNELKSNALKHWAPDLQGALGSAEAEDPRVRNAILKQLDVKIPSADVRAEATALQKIGFKTVDPLNPGLSTTVKRDIGNSVRDFVNQHVMDTLGGEDHSKLISLNKRMNAWLGVGSVAEARAEKEVAGRMSGSGLAHNLIGHGSLVGAGLMAAHGNLLGAGLSLAIPKVIEHAPAAARNATRVAAKVDTHLKAVADAAASGNPFAQKLLASIKNAPGGAARLAALQMNQPPTSMGPNDASQ